MSDKGFMEKTKETLVDAKDKVKEGLGLEKPPEQKVADQAKHVIDSYAKTAGEMRHLAKDQVKDLKGEANKRSDLEKKRVEEAKHCAQQKVEERRQDTIDALNQAQRHIQGH